MFPIMDWRSPNRTTRKPPPGEYVVFHERPFPERLDRAFRIAAVVVAAGVAVSLGCWLLISLRDQPPDSDGIRALVILLIIAIAMAYGFVRAIGLMTVGIVQTFRRKRYVVDWQEDPAKRR